jgi:Flp pilus assembly pilin Flp
MKAVVPRLLKSASGTTAIEYAFLTMFVALAIMALVRMLGVEVGAAFNNVSVGLQSSVRFEEDPPPD